MFTPDQNPLLAHRKNTDLPFSSILCNKLQTLEAVVNCIRLTNEHEPEKLTKGLLPFTLADVFQEYAEIFEHYFFENFDLSTEVEKRLIDLSIKLDSRPYILIEKIFDAIEIEIVEVPNETN